MPTRLSSIDRALNERLTTASPEQQRAAASAAALLAVDRTGLSGDGIDDAIATVTSRLPDPALGARMSALTEDLDEKAFAIQEQVDDGLATNAEYEAAFFAARAAAALQYALLDDPAQAAAESVYEAYAAVGEITELDHAIQRAWRA